MDSQKSSTAIDTIANSCIAVRLRLLNRVITKVYDEAFRPLGMKVSQFNILVVAAKLGLARPTEVCDILQLDTSTLSRNVERMRAHGWLEAVPGEDARTQPFRLTTKGRKLLERAVPGVGAGPREGGPTSRRRRGCPACQNGFQAGRDADGSLTPYFFRQILVYALSEAAVPHSMRSGRHETQKGVIES